MEIRTKSILHIDDDRDDLAMLQGVINELDSSYEILQAENGEEGLKKLEELKKEGALPCLIVLDVNMPKLDGRQTFQRIRADEELKTVPVVIFSTSKSSVDRLFFKGDRVEYISKPYEFGHLREVAGKLLQYCNKLR